MNMKKSLFLFVLTMLTAAAWAAPRSQQQALLEAKRFATSKGIIQADAPSLNYKAPRKQQSAGDAAYYVFNFGQAGGFVIVSGDDRTPTILGYSDSGEFDIDNLPAHIRSWFQGYADQIAMLDEGTAVARPKAPKRAKAKKDIPEMLTCRWNQDAPYYNLCPTDDGGQCVTGCVATAMAQVMYYHRANSVTATLDEIPSYTPFGTSTTFDGVATNSPIDWDNMLDTYTSSATDAQNTAVAQLMNYCGRSVKMNYASSSSGAQSENIATALVKYFGYVNTTRVDYRVNYDADEWEDLIYTELAENRPVLYAGNSLGGGHQFVVDGYSTDGLFHVNWGWGGMSNGYFLLSILNPENTSGIGASSTTDGYGMNQVVVIGAEPSATPMSLNVTGKMKASLKSFSGSTAYYTIFNQTGVSEKFHFGFAAENTSTGSQSFLAAWGTGSSPLETGVGYSNASINLQTYFNNKNLPAGTYRIVPMSKFQSEDVYTACQLELLDELYVVWDGSTAILSIKYAGGNLEAQPIDFNKLKYANVASVANVTIKNNGDKEYNGLVYLFASTTSTKGNIRTRSNLVLGAGKSDDVELYFVPASVGTYNVWITSDSQGNNVIGQTTVEITDGTGQYTNNTGLEYVSFSMNNTTTTKHILGNTMSGEIVIRNTGSLPFVGNLALRHWYIDWTVSQWKSNALTSVAANIPVGETMTIPFEYTDLDYSVNYGISLAYWTAGYIMPVNNQGYFYLDKGITIYTSDEGKKIVAATGNSFTTPNNALAVDLSAVSMSSVQPNSNPNTLYYIASGEATPSGLASSNVVKDNVAPSLTLTDGYGFYVPMTFTAATSQYQRTMTRSTNGVGGWETLLLPFEVENVVNQTNNTTIDWFHSSTDENKHFWVKTFTETDDEGTVYFDFADKIESNVPYIIAVPGNRWGSEWDLSGKTLRFNGVANQNIIPTNTLRLTTPTYNFCGSNTPTALTNIYDLDTEGSNFALTSTVTVPAFRAWFESNQSGNDGHTVLRIAQKDGNETGIITINNDETSKVNDGKWYTLDGRRISGTPQQHGIYIINNKKVIR